MLTIAYLANLFPAPVEPYVGEEIVELERRGATVLRCSVRPAAGQSSSADIPAEAILSLLPVHFVTLLQALFLAASRWKKISDLVARILFQGKERVLLRVKALAHTFLGACYAVRLRDREVDHIHAHHGYFGSWIAMTAARLLGIGYSITLHGSDLLLHKVYLDTKLKNCQWCVTVSHYNRDYILDHYPEIDPKKIIVSRMGVDTAAGGICRRIDYKPGRNLNIVAIGRLHPVKDHAFLIRACARLSERSVDFECAIAGEGPERPRLEALIRKHRLQNHVTLLGHVARSEIDAVYARADLIVLTSQSEGIPLALMEAMARGKIVLAPAITGIPELIIPGKLGFLYEPGNLRDFVEKVSLIQSLMHSNASFGKRLDWIRHGARVQILHNFSRQKNLSHFSNTFLRQAFFAASRPERSEIVQ